jgi:hypothetical protein
MKRYRRYSMVGQLSLVQVHAVFVQEGASDVAASADTDLAGTVETPTAVAQVDEEIIPVASAMECGGFDLAVPGDIVLR